MSVPHKTLAAIIAALLFAPAALAADPTAPKLYHWVGADGKDHYGDTLPPEALTQARQEISKNSGMTLKSVDRSLTLEERAAAQVKADADAKAAEAIEKAKQNDQVLLASYPSEAELKRAYDERISSLTETLKATRIGMQGQQEGLSSLLIAASNLELSNKPVNAKLATSIKSTHALLLEQQTSETQQEGQVAKLLQESAATMEHYRSIEAAAAASAAAHAGTPPTTPPPAAPPKG
ncbi:MAG TPA: DUF4124 domain-containing protein [Xanthomonadaceae bacterium]|nr:DUF4124 domain-containing protein [Xanthomonadaceae bacterium]